MLDKTFMEEANDEIKKIIDLTKQEFIRDINKIIITNTDSFKKNMYLEYQKILKKIQSESIIELQKSFNKKDPTNNDQLLIDLAELFLKS